METGWLSSPGRMSSPGPERVFFFVSLTYRDGWLLLPAIAVAEQIGEIALLSSRTFLRPGVLPTEARASAVGSDEPVRVVWSLVVSIWFVTVRLRPDHRPPCRGWVRPTPKEEKVHPGGKCEM